MNKSILFAIASTIVLACSSSAIASGNHSGQALKETGESGSHASASVGHSIAGSGQVTSGASAIPLAVVGSVGTVSKTVSNELMEAATAPIGTPLEITEESISAGPPPSEALKPKLNNQEI
ncbi:hypothetical protein ACQKP8_17130 [Photobacterium alginatilyticum]|uniref:hypothetical protein n=1 Tax=Photobacterium alginatilyticum TaxID=1775171 RepID=UPI00406861AA